MLPTMKKKTPFARKLIAFRESRELTQREAAEKIGVPIRTWIGWENGKKPSSMSFRLLTMTFPELKK